MPRALGGLILALVLPAGLDAAPPVPPLSDGQSVRAALTRFVDAFNNLDWDRFRAAFAPDASVFNPDIPEVTDLGRLDGRDVVEATFKAVFATARRGTGPPYLHIVPRNVRIQALPGVAVVTFEFDRGAGSRGRRTLVFERRGSEWKIIHLHASNVERSPALFTSARIRGGADLAEAGGQRKTQNVERTTPEFLAFYVWRLTFDVQAGVSQQPVGSAMGQSMTARLLVILCVLIIVGTSACRDRAPSGLATIAPGGPTVAAPFPEGLSGELLFQSDREGRYKLYVLDLHTQRIVRLTPLGDWDDFEAAWSPDGRRIALATSRAEKGTKKNDIFVMDADGANVDRLTYHEADEREPTWAADGKSVFFNGERDGRGELYRVWLHNKEVERLTYGIDRCISPAASPDGRYVAFAAQTIMTFQIHLLDLRTRESRQLTSGGGACRPNWSPDSRRIAYVRLDVEPSRIEEMDVGTGAMRPVVTDARMWSYYPSWSPDGRLIAFSASPEHHKGEDWDLALFDVAHPGTFRYLTRGPGNDRMPEWRPVATHIAPS